MFATEDIKRRDLEEILAAAQSAAAFAMEQAKRMFPQWRSVELPYYTNERGKWVRPDRENRWTDWMDGFFGHQLWRFYRLTRDEMWRQKAMAYTEPLAERRDDDTVHDLGFVIGKPFTEWLRFARQEDERQHIRETLVSAGRTLIGERPGRTGTRRWYPVGRDEGYMRAFYQTAEGTPGEYLFIDEMMNVFLVYRAASLTADPEQRSRLTNMADTHCRTSLKYLLRGDGSVSQAAVFSMPSEERYRRFLRWDAPQGADPSGCWARAAAWACYGFMEVFGLNADRAYLDAARSVARFFRARAPEDGVPPYDLSMTEPAAGEAMDADCLAIVGVSCLRLARATESAVERRAFYQIFLGAIRTLSRAPYLVRETRQEDGVITLCTYNKPRGLGINGATAFGDCYAVELFTEGALVEAEEIYPYLSD
jgi:unsaturated chondroitin disaccharide hydrolase